MTPSMEIERIYKIYPAYRNAMKRYVISLLSLCLLFAACAELQNSSAKVLDNAGDAIRTGEDKIWLEPEAQGTSNTETEEELNENSDEYSRRY